MFFTPRNCSTTTSASFRTHIFAQQDSFCFFGLSLSASASPSLSIENAKALLLKNISSPNVALRSLQSPDYQITSCLIGKANGLNLELFAIGDLQVYLGRSGQISQILRSIDSEVQTISGPFGPGDVLFLTTSQLNSNQFAIDIKKTVSTGDVDATEQLLLRSGLSLAALVTSPDPPITNSISIIPKFPSKKVLLVPLIVILLFLGWKIINSVFSYSNQKNQLEDMVVKAESILPLNPTSALKTATEAQTLLNSLKEQKKEDWQDDLGDRLNQILATKKSDTSPNPAPSVSPTQKTPTLQGDAKLWLDLNNIFPGANYSRLVLKDTLLYALDTTNKRLDQIDLANQKNEIFLRSNLLEQMQNLLSTPNGLFASSANTIYKLDRTGASALLKLDADGQTISPSYLSFWNNSLYILDTQARQIYKSTPNTRGFGKAIAWLKSGQKLDSDASSLTIDVNPYVLSKSNLVKEYSKGEKTAFILKGATGIDSATFLLTPPGSGKIIVSSANKIYVFDRSGQILNTLSLGDALPLDMVYYASSLYILESSQKILILPL